MKKLIICGFVLLAFACKKQETESFGAAVDNEISEGMPAKDQTPVELGKQIFSGKGNCVACHQVDQKVVGPSIQEIASIYKAKGGNIVAFLKDDAKPIVDPSQYEVMKTNFGLTKAMSDEELKGLEAYIYSNAK
ncbi:c-type cytochrome [Flavobacterium sp. 14A]|uniref:c-type cytochrome n=1 Tax=Flavobacterium sp. 14A TaxID=2735896 RepID=UPI00156F0250|nr:c-type cytochrome [Flavobacterium sp. 14A]NRT13046.1 cytochrome c [Flavobacterium sp. 14A]